MTLKETIMSSEVSERAIEAVARALYEVSAEPEHGATWEGIASKPWGDNFRAHARAAISAYTALSAPPIDDEVTQADRDAADSWFESVGEAFAGCVHGDSLAEAFARHRIAAAGEVRRRTIEALRPFAQAADHLAEGRGVWAPRPADGYIQAEDLRLASDLYRSLSAKEESR